METISKNSNHNNNNNNIINNLKQLHSKNNNSLYKKENISTSLPKIKIKKNPLSYKEIEKDTIVLNKEKRAVSQRTINYNIQKITNIKSKIATKFNANNNNNNDNNTNINNNIRSQLSLNELLSDYYPLYQPAKHSQKSFENIYSYGVNTYKGIIRQYNEDRVTILINASIKNNDNINNAYKISYFSIYDGHAGNKCCDYLKTYLHQYIFDSDFFPQNPIKAIEQGFKNCEKNFLNLINSKNQCIDSSGSCAIIILIINDFCYIINLGDSRALFSSDDGKKFFQLSRDHKPNDSMEKKRIYKAGGSIYRANIQQNTENSIGLNAKEVLVNLPYRIYPGRLSVSYFLIL
jgi:protein phosphatase 2C family protein 2/3